MNNKDKGQMADLFIRPKPFKTS